MFMKSMVFPFSLLALTTAGAVSAAAPSSTELKVKGTLVAPACTITAPGDGEYDFGRISPNLIKPNNTTVLPKQTKTWSITCDAGTYLTYRAYDNRGDSSAGGYTTHFGLGKVNEESATKFGKIGYYEVRMLEGRVDGVGTRVYIDDNNDGNFAVYPMVLVDGNNGRMRMGWASGNNSALIGKKFEMDLEVTPVLASQTMMNGAITGDVTLDGSLTLQFAYGL